MLRLVPLGLFGAFLGEFADRGGRRAGLLLLLLLSLVTSLIVVAVATAGHLAVWHLAVASFINGIAWAADGPFRRALIGDVVATGRMPVAMSIDIGTNSASRMIGPMLGGALLATVGIAGAFTLNVALYMVAFAATFAVRHRDSADRPAPGRLLSKIVEGLGVVRTEVRVRASLVITTIYNLFGWPFTSMIPVIAQDELRLAPVAIGFLASLEGVGAFIGSILIAKLSGPRHQGALFVVGFVLFEASLTLFALSPTTTLAAGALLAAGVAGAAYSIMQTTLVIVAAPPAMRGRMLGLLSVCIGVAPVGFLHLGFLADLLGAKWATALIGAEGLLVLVLCWPLWRGVTAPAKVAN